MIVLAQNMRQPGDHRFPQTQSLPVPVRRADLIEKLVVFQGLMQYIHQLRHIRNRFVGYLSSSHSHSVPNESPIYSFF